MLEPVRMVKVSVVGPKEYFKRTSEILHRLNLIHVEDYAEEDEYFKVGEPFEEASKFSKFLVTVRSALSLIKTDTHVPQKIFSVKELSEVVDKKVEEIEKVIGEKNSRIRQLEDELRSLDDEERVIHPLKTLKVPPDLLKGFKNIAVFVGLVKDNPFERISEITKEFEIFVEPYENEYVVAVYVKKEDASEVFKVLQEFAFRELAVPDVKDFDERLKEIARRREEIRAEIQKLRAEIEEYERENLDLMLALEEYLSIELEKSELPLKAATSKYAFIIVGYVPKESFEQFKREIEDKTGGKVVVSEIKDEKWNPPTALKNPKFAKPFELLTTAYGIPKYTEVDPTTIMAIVFPIFFGFMLGDIGYGLILLFLSLWLSKKLLSEGWQALLKVLLYSSISTIIFGLIYGEFFGFELFGHESLFLKLLGEESELAKTFAEMHPIVNRLYEAPALLVLTIGIGVLHMSLGYIFGIRNYIKEHGLKHAILEKFNWLLALISIAFIIAGFVVNTVNKLPAFNLNAFYIAAIPLIIVWAVLTIIGEGPMFLIEYLTLLSNTISYARLLAVGLASVGFAIAFNYIAFELLWPSGIAGIIAAVIVFAIGHFINLLLGILDPGLQSLRLHYVEHFVKFFEGGGYLYNPFGRKRRYTKED